MYTVVEVEELSPFLTAVVLAVDPDTPLPTSHLTVFSDEIMRIGTDIIAIMLIDMNSAMKEIPLQLLPLANKVVACIREHVDRLSGYSVSILDAISLCIES